MLVLAAVVRNPQVCERIRKEVDAATGGIRNVNLFDRPVMPYTEATILETLRYSSSPIVPHVASQDTSIAGTYTDNTVLQYSVALCISDFLFHICLLCADLADHHPSSSLHYSSGLMGHPQVYIFCS